MSVGGNAGESSQSSSTTKASFIAPAQLPALQSLWNQAGSFANPGGAQAAARNSASQAMGPLQGAVQTLQGLSNPQGQINAQAQSLSSGLGNMFRNEINPAIESAAVGNGTFGGGRQGVAQGVATGQLGQAYTQGLGDITARANQQAGVAASMIPALTGALQTTAMSPFSAGLQPLLQLSQILGNPAILDHMQQQGSGSESSSGFDIGFGSIFGG